MEFGWINIFGAGIVLLVLIPNIIYASKYKRTTLIVEVSNYLSICEQIGRYACIVLMWLPLFVWKFGFGSSGAMLLYLIANGFLVLNYYLFWVIYSRKKTLAKAMALAIIPSVIFLLSGVLLHHWCLVVAAIVFSFAHCRITYMTHKEY